LYTLPQNINSATHEFIDPGFVRHEPSNSFPPTIEAVPKMVRTQVHSKKTEKRIAVFKYSQFGL
jgi:hypothetical protein